MDKALVILIVCLCLVVEHYLPWRGLIGRTLSGWIKYLLIILTALIPISIYLILYGDLSNLALLWMVLLASGLTLFVLFMVDSAIDARNRADTAEEEGRKLRGKVDKGN